jgi:hypothetical protein
MNPSESDHVEPDGELDRWEAEMWSILTPLRATSNTARWLSTPEAVLATSDQLRAVSRDSTKWLLNHHCPIPDLAISFAAVLRASVTLADALVTQAQNPRGVNWPTLTREVNGFHRLLEQFLTQMREHATRLPPDAN